MSHDPNYTSLVSECLPDGTIIKYTRFWTPEEIAERQAEEAAWLAHRDSELAEQRELALIEIDQRIQKLTNDIASADRLGLIRAKTKLEEDLAADLARRAELLDQLS